jgi:glycine cleavage system H protein
MTTRHTKSHEFVRVEGGTGVVGITDYAQSQLGDVVFVELRQLANLSRAEAATVSVKGRQRSQRAGVGHGRRVNSACRSPGWSTGSFRHGLVSQNQVDAAGLDSLMDEDAYRKFLRPFLSPDSLNLTEILS